MRHREVAVVVVVMVVVVAALHWLSGLSGLVSLSAPVRIDPVPLPQQAQH